MSSDPGLGDRVSDSGGRELESSAAVVAPVRSRVDDPADRWLVWLRWVAIVGMAATILAADALVEGLETRSLMSVLLAIGASNLVWLMIFTRPLRRAGPEGPSPSDAPSGPRRVELQLVVDVLSLGLMLWFAGGIENPFAAFLAFQIALAGLLTTPRATLGIAALTIGVVGALAFAPPLPTISPVLVRTATAASLISLSGLLGAFAAVYARRLSQLRQESTQNERLAVLGRLVGSMSHELNTPLATVLLLSRDLERFGGDMPPEEQAEMVRSIALEAERANEIIGLVRGHVGPDLVAEPVELCAFVEEIATAELERLGFEGQHRFVLEGPVVVPVVKRALVQILANLLRNACEASLLRRKKRIFISVRSVEDRAEIAVEDRGPGFSPDVLARLGEPFQTTKEAQGGMGLGLYVSGLLARQIGATVVAETLRGGGARVVVAFDGRTGDD